MKVGAGWELKVVIPCRKLKQPLCAHSSTERATEAETMVCSSFIPSVALLVHPVALCIPLWAFINLQGL